ncbi:MAG: hypothetical protein HY973_00900 [Candidatus Kerfeldbacteria bacterium]|nr:hypothetical protein [Candidatus Kerfeldbacteria bacterium]
MPQLNWHASTMPIKQGYFGRRPDSDRLVPLEKRTFLRTVHSAGWP